MVSANACSRHLILFCCIMSLDVSVLETSGKVRSGDGVRCYLAGILFPILRNHSLTAIR